MRPIICPIAPSSCVVVGRSGVTQSVIQIFTRILSSPRVPRSLPLSHRSGQHGDHGTHRWRDEETRREPIPVPTCACSCGQILTYGGQPSSATSLTLISVASITDRDTRTHLVHTISRSWLLHALRQQDEAHARTDDSRIGHELWSLQEDGNLRASRRLPLPRPSLTSQSSTAPSPADTSFFFTVIESKTCHKARNDAVSFGRIHRFLI